MLHIPLPMSAGPQAALWHHALLWQFLLLGAARCSSIICSSHAATATWLQCCPSGIRSSAMLQGAIASLAVSKPLDQHKWRGVPACTRCVCLCESCVSDGYGAVGMHTPMPLGGRLASVWTAFVSRSASTRPCLCTALLTWALLQRAGGAACVCSAPGGL
jgi:hypothetical protein